MEERNEFYIGSARGPEYFNLVDALKHCGKHLENFGGHTQAAGFTLAKANLPNFIHCMQTYARHTLKETNTEPVLEVDTELSHQNINQSLIDQIETLSPFGHKNTRPLFVIKGAYLKDLKRVGQDRNHLLGNILVDQSEFNFIGFKMAEKVKNIQNFERFDIVFHVGTNTYKGVTKIQLQLIDLKRP